MYGWDLFFVLAGLVAALVLLVAAGILSLASKSVSPPSWAAFSAITGASAAQFLEWPIAMLVAAPLMALVVGACVNELAPAGIVSPTIMGLMAAGIFLFAGWVSVSVHQVIGVSVTAVILALGLMFYIGERRKLLGPRSNSG